MIAATTFELRRREGVARALVDLARELGVAIPTDSGLALLDPNLATDPLARAVLLGIAARKPDVLAVLREQRREGGTS
jgi:hypothetical protein